MKKLFSCIVLSSLLTGCGATVYGPNRLVNNVKIEPVLDLTCQTDGEVSATNPIKNINFQTDFFSKACDSYRTPGDRGKARIMLESGVTLNWMRCGDFFRQRAGNQTRQRIVRRSIAPISALITGVLGVIDFNTVDGQQEALQILGLAQTATLAGLEIYESEFLFGASNINSVRKLTMRDLDTHSRSILAQDDLNFYRVTRHLIDHQLRCTPANILELTQAAIETGSIQPSTPASRSTSDEQRDREVSASIAQIYNLVELSTEQLAVLWWLTNHGVTSDNELEVIKGRLGSLSSDIAFPDIPSYPMATSALNIPMPIKNQIGALSEETKTRFGIVKNRIQNAIGPARSVEEAIEFTEKIKFSNITASAVNNGAVETKVVE